MTTPASPAAAVWDAVEAAVVRWYGPEARLQFGPIERRSWSIHVLPSVSTPRGRVELIVKVPLWDGAPDLAAALAAGPQAATRAEFEALMGIEAMVRASGDPGLAAVRPVAYLAEVNAVVTERLSSQPLRGLRGQRAVDAGRVLGRWLRRFHDELGGAEDGAFEPGEIARDLAEMERRAAGRNLRLLDAIEGLRAAADGLAGSPVRRAVTHGDLGPSNVLVTGDGRVAVIDPNLVEAPVAADAAKLAAAVRTGRIRLLLGMPRGREPDPLEAAVLDGYGAGQDAVYLLLRRVAAVRRWLDVEEAASGLRGAALPAARRVLAAESR